MRSTNFVQMLMRLGALVCILSLTASCDTRPTVYVTGKDYITLQKGQSFIPTRDMTLATESVIQAKDEQILNLLQTVAELRARLDHELSRGD